MSGLPGCELPEKDVGGTECGYDRRRQALVDGVFSTEVVGGRPPHESRIHSTAGKIGYLSDETFCDNNRPCPAKEGAAYSRRLSLLAAIGSFLLLSLHLVRSTLPTGPQPTSSTPNLLVFSLCRLRINDYSSVFQQMSRHPQSYHQV